MESKVTNYEISKRLHELGFECESHCGWWSISEEHNKAQWNVFKPTVATQTYIIVKSYDCWDLLMWLRKNQWLKSPHHTTFLVGKNTFSAMVEDLYENNLYWEAIEKTANSKPQNALGLAVIKILDE